MFRTFSKLTRNAVSNYSFSTGRTSFNKVVNSIDEALVGIKTGDKVLVGGFGLCGSPENLLGGIKQMGSNKLRDITIVSNNFGIDGYGPGILLHTNQVKRVMVSYFGENRELERQYIEGELEVEFIPQGTLAEKCRAGGAGIPAFYTPTGVGTPVQFGGFPIKYKKGTMEAEITTEPRECVNINGREYLREMSITGDFGLIKAWKADKKGNLIFNKTARNMNPDFATAAKITVAEVEEIVEEGDLHPNEIHIPGIYIDRVIKGDHYVKKIEKVMYDEPEGGKEVSKAQLKRNRIAQRAAKEIQTGTYINLGVGLPTLIPGFLPQGVEVILQSENGVLGVGKYPRPGQEDPDLINAGKETITVNPAASYFSSSQSFAIIRGRHLDWTVLGGMQVSQTGDLSNWVIPGKRVKGMGGAMDLVSSGSKVMVMMEHINKNGEHKILKQNVLPLTGKGVVNVLVTDMATFKFKEDGMYLTEIEKGYTLEDIRRNTGADFKVADDLKQAQ